MYFFISIYYYILFLYFTTIYYFFILIYYYVFFTIPAYFCNSFFANVTKYIIPDIITIIGPVGIFQKYDNISPTIPENIENITDNK